MQPENSESLFDSQRRYDSYSQAHHAVVEKVVDESECAADDSSDEFYDCEINIEDQWSDSSDEAAYTEAKSNTQYQGPLRPSLGCKPHKQQVKERANAVKPPVNYYERLGIQRDATEDEYITKIKRAAKKMRLHVHPHRLITEHTSEEEAKQVNERAAEVGEAAVSLLNPYTISSVSAFSDAAANAMAATKT
ncbi:hypothetical protein MMC26_006897 [Xylographa opegraphella]|nr:hypothetical protein [Xylographa opegraphella]